MKKKKNLSGISLRLLPYAHCDLAALHTRGWHKIRYAQIFDRVMQLMETMPGFRWYFDCYRSQLQAVFEKYPEKKVLFDRYIRDNRLNFIGAYANLRPNMTGEETYLRNLFLIRRIMPEAVCKVYGEEVDVALGHAQIPQILRQFGYELYKVYRPGEVLDAKGIPSSFRWKGADGSEIDVVRSDYSAFDKKGTDDIHTAKDAENYLFENAEECIEKSDIDLVWVNCGCDDALPFTTNQANNGGKVYDVDMQKVLSLFGKDNVRLACPMEFYEELKAHRKDLRTIEGTLDCADVSYNIAVNGEQGFVPLRLRADELLTRAERWQVLAEDLGIRIGFDFEPRWKDLLTACSHAAQWMFEEDYQKIRSLLVSVIRDAEAYIGRIADGIAERIGAGEDTLAACFSDSRFSGYRTVTLTIPCADGLQLRLEDGRGENVEFETIGTHDYNNTWELIVNARVFLPAYGYNTVRARSGDVRALYGKPAVPKKAPEMHSADGIFSVRLGGADLTFENGSLIRVGGYCAEKENAFNKLTYYGYPYYGSWWEDYADCRDEAVWHSAGTAGYGGNITEIILQGTLHGIAVTQTIRCTDPARLDFAVDFDWKPANAWLTASVPSDSCSRVFCDIPFGTQTVDAEAEYSDEMFPKYFVHRKRRGVLAAKRFISAECGRKPIALLRGNGDRYFQCDVIQKNLGIILLSSIQRTKGLWEEDINSCIEAAGKHSVTYSVLFGEPSEEALDALYSRPFISDMAREHPCGSHTLPPCASLFPVNGQDAAVTSLRKEGDSVYLRIAETRGIGQDVSFPQGRYKTCTAVRLSGEPAAPVQAENGMFAYRLKPFEIITFRLQ